MTHLALRLSALLLFVFAAPAWGQGGMVAVTFDDLPYQATDAELCDAEAALDLTRGFLAMLRPLDTRGVAFVNEGRVCEAVRDVVVPQVIDLWLDAGLEMGNHTASHPSLHGTTAAAWLDDVDRGARLTRPLLERRGQALRWFRHPYLHAGDTPEKKAEADGGLAARGYVVAPVTIDNNDWMFAAVYRRADGDPALRRRIGEAYVAHMAAVLDHWEPYSAELTGGREPAQVLLLHANSLNLDWYPAIHALFLERGYRFVTLEETLADPVYALPDAFTRNAGVSWLHRWTFTQGRPIRWEPEPPQWVRDAYAALGE